MSPKEAAAWSHQAYEPEGQEWAAQRGFSFVLLNEGAHQCIVGSNEFETIVAFRGTEFNRLADIKTNMMMSKVSAKGCRGKVHRGYHNGVWALIPKFKHLLKGDVYFAGHSMGAAMATIAGAILKPRAVYSFNSPKCGNPTFARHYPIPIFRFVSKNDPVQSIPSDTPDWVHVGHKIGLESTGMRWIGLLGCFSHHHWEVGSSRVNKILLRYQMVPSKNHDQKLTGKKFYTRLISHCFI